MGKRRAAREMAIQMLYQSELGETPAREVLSAYDLADYLRESGRASALTGKREQAEEALRYARVLVAGTLEHRDEIDRLIEAQAENWRLSRMPAVDRNILRLAVFELQYEDETPNLVVVDEAIELAKKFGTEQSSRFINGLLDGLLRRGAAAGSEA